ncbi:MAG: nicotinate (nicotinamide) nucleotide adenylyltransferase [Bacteroidales bacterium]|jgi:nicotinate-nucleotide adenylyltransferase|nr:nicotinate (nicotinamide) nucleotide adenylyltransferase [Bacteroidales bacterium]
MSGSSKTGLFFGSFNPIHNGHLMIAGYIVEYTDIDHVWFVVSPQNPLKDKASLLADHHRLAMVNMAIEDDTRFRSSNIEFKMPKPSYTIDTLTWLGEKFPTREFVLIAGTDILPTFHKWKNWEELLRQYRFYLYPRSGSEPHLPGNHPAFTFIDAPFVSVSSSLIRKGIGEGKDMRYFLPDRVWKYVKEMHFYEK